MSLPSIVEHLLYNINIFASSSALVFYNDIRVYSSVPYLVYILDTFAYNAWIYDVYNKFVLFMVDNIESLWDIV